jgi:hypothetical protein
MFLKIPVYEIPRIVSTMTESVGNETIENTGDFCLVIRADHALTGFFNLR